MAKTPCNKESLVTLHCPRHQLEEIFDLPLALKIGDVDIVSREWWISFELPSLHMAEFMKVTNYVSQETTEVFRIWH